MIDILLEALRLNEADANDLDHIFESADLKNDQLKNQPGDAELTEGARIQQDTGESSEVPSEADSKLALLSDRIRRTTTVQAVRDRTKSFKKSLKESMRKRLDRVAVKLDQVSVKLDQVAGKLDRVAGKLERVGRPLRVFKTKVVMKFDRLDGDISMKLREEWAAFEASLRPEGSPLHQVWLVPCTTNHGGSYISYDPELILFRGSTQLPWEQHNFISTANTATRHSCFNSDGSYVPSSIEHYVEFAVVNSFDLHARKGTTWRQKFVRLHIIHNTPD